MPVVRLKNPFKVNEEKQLQKLQKKNKLKELNQKAVELNNENAVNKFNSKIQLFDQIDNENIIKAECDLEVNPSDKSVSKVNCNYQLLKIQKQEPEIKQPIEIDNDNEN